MKISVGQDVGFKGEAPRIAPRLLPNENSQEAEMAKLLRGSLESWKENEELFQLPKTILT